MGITWTQTFISGMETSPLPLTSQLIPVANGNFNYTGLTVPLTFNSQLPTGPNPNNTDIPLGIPFPFVRITYSPSGTQPARVCTFAALQLRLPGVRPRSFS